MTKRAKEKQRCRCCKKRFLPDPRVGDRQKYCAQPACQRKRQQKNEYSWRRKNPEAVYEQRRKWQRNNADYWDSWRRSHDDYLKSNRIFMRGYMRRKRQSLRFVKSKEMKLQLAGIRGVAKEKWYISRGCRWLIVRLERASRLSRLHDLGHTLSVRNCLPRGRLYDVLKGQCKGP